MTEDDMVESVPRRVRKTDLKLQVEEELVRFIKHIIQNRIIVRIVINVSGNVP